MSRQLDLVHDKLVNGHVIEASAGTGKTYSVAALVTRELARREDLRISEVLITTFTRNAAAELRDRIRRRIAETAEALREHRDSGATTAMESGDETVVALSADVDQLDDVIRRLERAVVEFDAATISTIHAVCHRIMTMAGLAGRSQDQEDMSRQLIGELVNDELVVRALSTSAVVFDEEAVIEVVSAALDSPLSDLWFATEDAEGNPIGLVEAEALVELKLLVTRVVNTMHERTANQPTFNDQVRQAEKILATDEYANVRSRIAERYKLAFVDEAQDTDGLQWSLFRHIFPNTTDDSERALVAVGDPKQAIYSFRGADVISYLAERDSANMSTLNTNFRSDQPLVDALNSLFKDSTFGADIAYQPVVASDNHQHSAIDGVAPCEILDIGDVTNKNNVDDAVIKRILQLLNSVTIIEDGVSRALEPKDICVLTETNAASTIIQRNLARSGVPAVSSGAESVFAGELATEMRILLHALDHIADVGRVRRAATSSFFGYAMTDPRLFPQSMVHYEDPDARDDLVVELQTTLLDWKAALRTNGVAGLQAAILANEHVAKNLVSGTFGERNLTDFSHIFEAILGQTSGSSMSTGEIISIFDNLATLDKNSEIVRRRVESDLDAVTIMTTHGAKGLEFPVVIVAQLWKEREYSSSRVPKYYRPFEDQPQKSRSVIDIGWAMDLTAHDSPTFVVNAENEEQRRVLYVAMTRARHHLTLCVPTGAKGAPILEATLNTEVFGSKGAGSAKIPVISIDDLPSPQRYAPRTAVHKDTLSLADGPTKVRQTYVRTSFTGLTEAYKRTIHSRQQGFESVGGGGDESLARLLDIPRYAPDDTELGVAAMPLADIRGGTYIGKVVHGIYEHIDLAAVDLESEVRRVTNKFMAGTQQGSLAHRVADGIHRSLTTPLGPEFSRRTIVQLQPSPQLQELRFEMAVELLNAGVTVSDFGQVLIDMLANGDALFDYAHALADDAFDIPIAGLVNGSIDTVINAGTDEEPRLFITDWKSNRLDSETDDTFIQAYSPHRLIAAMEHHHYPLQAMLYGVAMYRYLRWRAPHIDADSAIVGVAYFFIRGMVGPDTPRDDTDHPFGVFTWTPPPGLWARLSNVLAGIRS